MLLKRRHRWTTETAFLQERGNIFCKAEREGNNERTRNERVGVGGKHNAVGRLNFRAAVPRKASHSSRRPRTESPMAQGVWALVVQGSLHRDDMPPAQKDGRNSALYGPLRRRMIENGDWDRYVPLCLSACKPLNERDRHRVAQDICTLRTSLERERMD